MITFTTADVVLTELIIACAMAVHEQLGPGFLERVYHQCLQIELKARGVSFKHDRTIPLVYRGVALKAAYRFDFLIEDRVIVEVKAVEALAHVHRAQIINYLKLTGLPIGLLINFNVPLLKDGVRRLEHPDVYRQSLMERASRKTVQK